MDSTSIKEEVMSIDALRRMLLSRAFEEKLQELFSKGLLYGTTHLNIGQEASHVGLADGIEKSDWIVPTHRCHGFNIATGSDIEAMFSEMLGSAHGLCRGLGGSMHMSDRKHNNLGSSAIVGSGVALASGLAFALKRQRKESIAVAIFGDGATSRGVVHEAMNLSAVWSLPVLFYCENNHYGMSASSDRMISIGDISKRAESYSMEAFKADGNDYRSVRSVVSAAREYIVSASKPALVVVDTYRLCGHSKSDKLVYRSREEEDSWSRKDPIERLSGNLGLSLDELEREREEAERLIQEAYERAYLKKDDVVSSSELANLTAEPVRNTPIQTGTCHETTCREAINEALDEILSSDDRATLIGEDVGIYGGCFGVTRNLVSKYPDKVLETPVSEEAFTGMAVGASALGEHPIVEIMYGDFSTLSSDALINHAAKLRFMSAGQFTSPLVFRAPMGCGTGHGSQHTQSLEGMFLSTPGLKVVAPSDPFTFKSLLKEAVNDPDPVIFIEYKSLYSEKGYCGDSTSSFPLGRARCLKKGTKATVIGYAHSVKTIMDAAGEYDVDVIDLLSLRPLDEKTILESVKKTGRVLIVQETPLNGSVGSSVASLISTDEKAFGALEKPISILSQNDTPVPFSSSLEQSCIPTVDKVILALEKLLS